MLAVIKHAWELYRQNFFPLITLMLVVWIPCDCFSSWMDANVFPPDDFRMSLELHRVLDCLIGIIATSAIFYFLRERTAQRPVTLVAALGAGFKFWGPMFVTRFIVGIAYIFGLILLILPGIYLMIRLSLCELLVAGEGASGFDAVRRSVKLTEGNFWRIFGWLLVGSLPAILVAAIVYIPFPFFLSSDNWIPDAIASCLADIPLIFFYTLTWAVYVRLHQIKDETLAGASKISAPLITPT
jgi:uncharacterized membrane protein